MRRLNALLAAALLILLAWHGLAGSFMLLGVNAGTGKIAGWTAMALAAEVVSEIPFEPVGEQAYLQAEKLLDSCEAVLCPLTVFGTMNSRNRELWRSAKELGKLRQINLDKSDSGDILIYK